MLENECVHLWTRRVSKNNFRLNSMELEWVRKIYIVDNNNINISPPSKMGKERHLIGFHQKCVCACVWVSIIKTNSECHKIHPHYCYCRQLYIAFIPHIFIQMFPWNFLRSRRKTMNYVHPLELSCFFFWHSRFSAPLKFVWSRKKNKYEVLLIDGHRAFFIFSSCIPPSLASEHTECGSKFSPS